MTHHRTKLRVRLVPSRQMLADPISRWSFDPSEYSLNPQIFQQIRSRFKAFCNPDFHMFARFVTTKPTPDTVHSPTPGQLHVESIQLAFTFALCCCYAFCMKCEELLIFYSFWLRCFVVMMQYVGFLGRSQLFGGQVKVGAPTWHLARANCKVGAPSPVLARANCPILGVRLHPMFHVHPSYIPFAFWASHHFIMPAKQPKKGKGKKVTATDPTFAPANPEVQAVLDAHIANVGSEHFPAGYFPIPYTLTPPWDAAF